MERRTVSNLGRIAELEWRDDLCVGEPTIDDQHKGFIDLAKRIGSLISAQAPSALILANVEAIVVSTGHHFTTEEGILNQVGFPEVASHRLDHAVIYDQVSGLVARLSVQSSGEEIATAVRTIVAILVEHMQLKDMEFRSLFRRRNSPDAVSAVISTISQTHRASARDRPSAWPAGAPPSW